jgi:hypothetical protein
MCWPCLVIVKQGGYHNVTPSPWSWGVHAPGQATRPFYAWNHALTNHVLFIYNPGGIPVEHHGCLPGFICDVVTYQASFPVVWYVLLRLGRSFSRKPAL